MPIVFEDVGQRHPVDDADGDLTDNPRLDDFRGDPFRQGEEEEKGDND